MPNPTPSEAIHPDIPADDMVGDNWIVEVSSYRTVGMAIACFNNAIGYDAFTGTAEMVVEDGIRKLEIVLLCDESERFQCSVCKKTPARPTMSDPGICTFCGQKVCGNCSRAHERAHWRPVKTIGGDVLCDGDKVRCGRDQCPVCHGVPF